MSGPVDFDLHGIVSLRLVDPQPRDTAAVERQLGPIRAALADEPDISIRFVERVETHGELRYLGVRDGAFDDRGFLVLRAKQKSAARVRIPLDQVGGRCEIVCEHGTLAVPLLVAIVNLTALSRGALPLHAAAFEWRGEGAVVTGWSKGGKTETLLSFMRQGARYVADEWCYLAADGQRMFGVPEPVRLWHWQLAQLADLRAAVPLPVRLRLGALGRLPALADALPAHWQRRAPGRALRRLSGVVEPRLHALVPPERLFRQPVAASEARFSRLFLTLSADRSDTVARQIDPAEVASRMQHSLQYERLPLLQYYAMFRFAFPELSNPWIEKAAERERALLERVFAGKPTWCIEHPYPVEIPRLFECMQPLFG